SCLATACKNTTLFINILYTPNNTPFFFDFITILGNLFCAFDSVSTTQPGKPLSKYVIGLIQFSELDKLWCFK
ncbi:MAG TPA: hypothetical protein DD729_05285, partial [Rhodobacteraceae bacterium]|nr:hypothetical protein [Paracoccaceae bacterium]